METTQQPATTGAPPQVSDRRLTFTIVALGVGAIASILDSTIVNVAVGHLAQVFGTSLTATQCVITGFLLAMTAVVPLSGWMIDRLGGRATWTTALGVFFAGSVLSGLAWDLPSLIGFRVLQGLGAGLILPAMMALMAQAAGRERLMVAMGSLSLMVQVGPILGPVVGGALVQGANWRWLFLVNIPFCVAGLILARIVLPPRQDDGQKRSLDAVGLALLAPALVAVIYGLSNVDAGSGPASAGVWAPIATGFALLAAFVLWSLRDGTKALIDVRLFRDRSFTVAGGLTVLSGFTMFGGLLLLPLYFQQVRGASIIEAGLLLVPQGLGAAVLIIFAKKLLADVPARWRIIGGFILMALGTIPFAFPATRDMTWLLIVSLVVRGMGIGAGTPSISALAVAGLPKAEIARGTTAFNIVQRIGAPFGTTVIAIVLTRAIGHAPHTAAGPATAFGTAFWWTVAFTAAPIALACLLPKAEKQQS
ncbi:DHA2 family efflux MFS transporter permease subunit [Nonomuraea sp. NPDC005501]|uniref:DHA2 family efflux MFS transporter permease subunit n=1 Tax=Nonomuraea sp. NPDC005501 TaxID=3156884 RepID=UPI0033A7DFB4